MRAHRALYAFAPFGTAFAALLPESRHPGKLASAALRKAGIDLEQDRSRFEYDVMLSLWRSMLLLRHGLEAPVPEVEKLLSKEVHGTGLARVEAILEEEPGTILAIPHYGAFIPLLMKMSQVCKGKKKFNVIFNDPKVTPSNAQYGELFARLGVDGSVLYPDRRGTISALKALKRGECLAILPDVYFGSATTMAVPFFNRLLRVMPGTAFLATRTATKIIPLYATPNRTMGFEVHIGSIIDPADHACDDDDQSQFSIIRALSSELERQFRSCPAPWNYWASLRERSTRLPQPDLSSPASVLAAIESRVAESPTLLRKVPNLGDDLAAVKLSIPHRSA